MYGNPIIPATESRLWRTRWYNLFRAQVYMLRRGAFRNLYTKDFNRTIKNCVRFFKGLTIPKFLISHCCKLSRQKVHVHIYCKTTIFLSYSLADILHWIPFQCLLQIGLGHDGCPSHYHRLDMLDASQWPGARLQALGQQYISIHNKMLFP